MAFLQSTLGTSMLLLALLVIASATDYEYGPAPKLEDPKPNTDYKPLPTKPDYGPAPKLENPKPNTDYELHIAKPDYGYGPASKPENPKPNTDYKPQLPTKPDYGYGPTPKVENPKPNTDYKPLPTKPADYGYAPAPKVENPKHNTDYKPHPSKPNYGHGPAPKVENPKPKTDYPTKPDYEVPKPKGKDELQLLPTIIGVQGVVLCKSGSNYFPIQGAVARVTCGYEDEYGYETGPMSVLSHVTDSKGYFFATLSLGSKLKLTECKAYLETSPLETCKVPTDVNYGISGALLSSYRLLDNKMKLYTVGPFFCTSQYAKQVPNGY